MPTKVVVNDADGGTIALVLKEDVQTSLDYAAKLRSEPQTRTDGLKHVAHIPDAVALQWFNESQQQTKEPLRWLGPEHSEMIWRKLQDPDWKNLRVDGPSHQIGYGR